MPGRGQVSQDGKWWWDGTQWVPMPSPASASTAMQPTAGIAQTHPQMPAAGQAVFVYGPKTNGSAVASLVFGILSWFLCPLIGGLLAIIFGHVARGQIRRSGESGGGLAIAGLILGYAHIAVSIVTVFILLVIFGSMAAAINAIGHLPSPTP